MDEREDRELDERRLEYERDELRLLRRPRLSLELDDERDDERDEPKDQKKMIET